MKKYFPSSELIINEDGSVFHLHVKLEWLADKVILVGDPGRVALVASHFENKECEVEKPRNSKQSRVHIKVNESQWFLPELVATISTSL